MANVDVNFFKTMTPELAYVLGLWASDGCIFKGHKNRPNPSLTCHLGMNDEDVMRWVAKTIVFKNKVLK